MSTPTGQPPGMSPWQASQAPTPATAPSNSENEDGVTVRPMRLKVLYTFDDQNKTNCLARWPHVLHIQTVAMDETTSIGVIELKTCIDAIVQCSPELVARLGQDYTVYAYDYSEYDNPLVGQGMLSKALTAASPTPDLPASQSRQLITGRVCKNILGIFTNGVKETLEVKLRLVPVPTMLQGEYANTMGKYREMSKGICNGMEGQEWNSFLQSNPNLGQMTSGSSPASGMNNMSNTLRDGMSMEVMNQLLSPHLQQPPAQDPFNQVSLLPPHNHTAMNMNAENSGNESRGTKTAAENSKKAPRPSSRASVKKRPRGRKPKATTASAMGGNTSGYEEGTDGDDGPANKKRAKVTKTDWNSNTTLGMTPDSLRVAAGTSGSLRLFRPIAAHPNAGGPSTNHLQDIPRVPTPVPHLPNKHIQRDLGPSQSSFRRDPFVQLPQMAPQNMSSYPALQQSDDQVRTSIESTHFSPERNFSPVDTPPDISSSPPVMRTRPPSTIRSSPPCPSSPVLPTMPRTDSGFMSGSLEDLFGEEDESMEPANDHDLGFASQEQLRGPPPVGSGHSHHGGSDFDLVIQEEIPGNMELLPTRMPIIDLPTQGRARAKLNRAGSVASEDGISLPPLKNSKRAPIRRTMSQSDIKHSQYNPQKSSLGPQAPKTISRSEQEPQQFSQSQPPPDIRQPGQTSQLSQTRMSQPPFNAPSQLPNAASGAPATLPIPPSAFSQPVVKAPSPAPLQETTPLPVTIMAPAPAPGSRPTSRSEMMVRTASMGSLTLPQIPASDPVLPTSTLHRSQTWSEAPPPPVSEAHMPHIQVQPQTQMTQQVPPAVDYRRPAPVPYSRTLNAKKASIKQKLELAIANGEMPPFCANCGAIDTPTWRKAWSQDLPGVPGYYEYSDDPGCVTTIIILTRDAEGKPTSHKLIKKFLGPEEDQKDFDEFLLCNPCGIWMSKYRTQRPEDKWGNGGPQERARGEQKKRSTQRLSRPRKPPTSSAMMPTSEANFMQSDAQFPASDANFPISEPPAAPDGISPGDTIGVQTTASLTEHTQRQRSTSAQPKKRLNAMTSDAASAALRRAIQSSPARWVGTQHSPIELEEDETLDPTRRLLFPSPRKDGSPKVLGEVVANVVQMGTDFRSPKESMAAIEGQNKENMPPAIEGDDLDAEFLHLFEEEMAKGDEIQRPSTPVQKSPTQNPFKTPTRPTTSHRPITRSVTRSVRSARSNRSAKSPSELLTFTRTPIRTPGSAIRRMLSPRYVDGVFESPFTATLNQMMSEANSRTSPTRNEGLDMELDFGNLPELPQLGQGSGDMHFNMEDFFSTDVPMPSSPPRMGNYQIYEDSVTTMSKMNKLDWSEFGKFATEHIAAEKKVMIKEEPANSPVKLSGKEEEVAKESADAAPE